MHSKLGYHSLEFALFGYLLIRTWLSPLQFLANANLFLILAALTTYFLSAALLTELRWRLFFIGGFLLLEIGHLWVGIIQYVAGNNFLPFGYVRPDYGLRASGFYVCPNHFAGFLESLALLVLALALFARLQLWIRIVLIYLATAAFAGVLISGSRGGYLSSGVGLVVLVIYGFYHSFRVAPSRVQQLLLSAIGAGGVVLLIGSIFVTHSEFLTQRLGSVIEPRDLRPRLWQAALREFALDPVVGTGAGTYLIYGRKFRDPSIQSDPIYAHDDYVQLLAEYGVIGGALFVGFLAAHLTSAWKFIRRMLRWLQQNEKTFSSSLALAVGASLGVVALMVHSFFDFNLQIPGNTLFVAFLFGSRLQLEGRNAEAAAAYRHSNQLSANQIATVGLNQTLEATKIAQPTVNPTP